METSQLIIERSLYASLLRVALKLNRTVNPEDFQPISNISQAKQERAIKALGNKYIGIYGVIISMCLINVIYASFFTIQIKKILNKTAAGIWLK